jgi:hypothetical protein
MPFLRFFSLTDYTDYTDFILETRIKYVWDEQDWKDLWDLIGMG